jgi:predicted N-acetyltransferase YhbS
MNIEKATPMDIPAIEKLVNSAYRGEQSRAGWTHEADLVEGDERIDAATLQDMLNDENVTILMYKDGIQLLGCVYLQKKKEVMYLGMLSVLPTAQTNGIGKALMRAAEDHAKQQDCSSIIMSVISVRKELIEWYDRRGFIDTGERQPFPTGAKVGRPKQPLEFVILSKMI